MQQIPKLSLKNALHKKINSFAENCLGEKSVNILY